MARSPHFTFGLVMLAGASGCGLAQLPDDAAARLDAPIVVPDAEAVDAMVLPDATVIPFAGELDVLFVIDDSSSIATEQAAFVAAIPQMISAIATGDRDADGTADFPAPSSMHVALVTTDMGLGDVTGIPTCNPGFGDDGLMLVAPRHPATGCSTSYAPIYGGNVLHHDATDTRTAAQFATDVACIAAFGAEGCGYTLPLEATLKAISLVPTATGDSPVSWTAAGYRPPTFYAGTFGHGGDPMTNGGFLRPGSIFAVVIVTDADDCSTPNPHIFAADDPTYDRVAAGLRCHEYGDELFPVQRYVDGLLGMRADPHRLVLSVVAGVPPSVAGRDPTIILGDPAMTEQIDPMRPSELLPACVGASGGVATPAIRLTQLALGLRASGARATVRSICDPDFAGVVGPIAEALAAP